jgi:nucleoside-diphosphate-sugar epimerase
MIKENILITGGSGFIGKNLSQILYDKKINFKNIDIKKPDLVFLEKNWIKCDILNVKKLNSIIKAEKPSYIIHLAAITDTLSNNLNYYETNTKGTENLIEVCNEVSSIKKIIITSTQYVYRDLLNPTPISDTDFKHHTIYGLSKAISEKITRNKCKKSFVIIRPTNIWGPYSVNYANGLFKAIKKGLFVLPSNNNSLKSYGYVKNICFQILDIIYDQNNSGNVYYVGENMIKSNIWTKKIFFEINGYNPLKVPQFILLIGSKFGDILRKVGINFPLYSIRYKNMIQSYEVPIKKTLDRYPLRYPDLNKNIIETIKWYKNDY